MNDTPHTILVYVGLDLVGDGLMKLPVLRALRQSFPQAKITWLAGKGSSVYAGSLNPLASRLLDEIIDDAGIGSRPAELLSRPLPGRSFDLILDTQTRLLTTLILRRIRHRRFISATAGFLFSSARPRTRSRPAALAQQLMQLVDLAGGRLGDSMPLVLDRETEDLADGLLPPGPVYVGFAPGAGGRHKCWPLARFLESAATVAAEGAVPVFFLGPAETDWAESVRAALPSAVLPLQGVDTPTPMLTIALGRRLAAAVANDSGTGHLLAAADVPLVSLFGPTPAEKFAPAARNLAIVRAQDWGGKAMDLIPPRAVDAALRRMLARSERLAEGRFTPALL